MAVNLSLGHTQRIISAARSAGLTMPQMAYVLATSLWETARTMQPVREAYYLGEPKAENYRKKLRYYPWYGRGFVQLTWRENYLKAGSKIGVDLIAKPDAAMDPDNAAKILVLGSRDGWFTGKKLSDYISGSKVDYAGARRIINGTDKAAEIAALAREYEAALRAAPTVPVVDATTGRGSGIVAALVALLKAMFGGK